MIKNNFVVTTGIKSNDDLILKAKEIGKEFNVCYIERKKETLNFMILKYNNLFIVYKDKILFYDNFNNKLFFHLDTVIIRLQNNNDALSNLIEEKNQKILDITMGLARDSIVLSYFGHNITALENNKIIYKIVSFGLKNYDSGNLKINECMKKINTINVDNYEYLKKCKDNEYDIIYADPMFENKIKYSNNLNGISCLANINKIDEKLFKEMVRVAKNKIIIKAHNKDDVFLKFNLIKKERTGSKFSYGIYYIGE